MAKLYHQGSTGRTGAARPSSPSGGESSQPPQSSRPRSKRPSPATNCPHTTLTNTEGVLVRKGMASAMPQQAPQHPKRRPPAMAAFVVYLAMLEPIVEFWSQFHPEPRKPNVHPKDVDWMQRHWQEPLKAPMYESWEELYIAGGRFGVKGSSTSSIANTHPLHGKFTGSEGSPFHCESRFRRRRLIISKMQPNIRGNADSQP